MTTNYHVQLAGATKYWITIFRTGSVIEAIEQCQIERSKHPGNAYRVVKRIEEIIKC